MPFRTVLWKQCYKYVRRKSKKSCTFHNCDIFSRPLQSIYQNMTCNTSMCCNILTYIFLHTHTHKTPCTQKKGLQNFIPWWLSQWWGISGLPSYTSVDVSVSCSKMFLDVQESFFMHSFWPLTHQPWLYSYHCIYPLTYQNQHTSHSNLVLTILMHLCRNNHLLYPFNNVMQRCGLCLT